MTLEEAIQHAKEKAERHTRCGEEHQQLAKWLEELLWLRDRVPELESLCASLEADNEELRNKI